MKQLTWRKLGKIFDPADFTLPNNCVSYAQSPQALVFDGFVRIYFGTREQEETTGKYLSHPAYVDFTKSFDKIIGVSTATVVELGKLGCFDEHGIFPLNVLRHENRIYGYSCGWSRRVSVSVETATGLAFSDDGGKTFQKYGDGPVLSASLDEPYLVGDSFVRVYDNIFHMWYMFGTQWKKFSEDAAPDRTYKIGHATSIDGINWKRTGGHQIIEDKLGPEESMALPSVCQFQGQYHMFFCYRHSSDFRNNKDRGYRLGYASSDDLETWKRDDKKGGIDVSEHGWDSDTMCYPHIFECEGKVYLLYNGNEFGRHGFGIAVLE